MGTPFVDVYNRFLGKITDDMYVELTPQDTIRDLRNMIIEAIPGFEFPRKNLYNYEIKTEIVREDLVLPTDFSSVSQEKVMLSPFHQNSDWMIL